MVDVAVEAPRVKDGPALCPHCQAIGACQPQADLQAMVSTRKLLEADYGWDVFGFIAEAKRQYRKAKGYHCPDLRAVQAHAAILAPEVDFSRVD
jgi:hypothetical protein